MRRGTRILSLFGIIVLLLVAFQPVQVKAAGPSDPENVNYASSSHGAAASAGTWASAYEPAKAIDGSTGTAWRATANDALTVTFGSERDIREVHVHLADYAMPEVDLYYQDAAGSFVLLESWSGNTATTLIHNVDGGVAAYGLRVSFPSPLTHTHSYIHTHLECTYRHWHSGGPTPMGAELDGAGGSGYWHCHAWSSYQETHTYTETHYARVAEAEAWGDDLPDAYEEAWWYRQSASVTGTALALPDNGADVLVLGVERPLWSGVDTRAFLDLEVDHGATGDLAVAVGFWDGATWDDRLVWVPGSFSNASIWDTAVASHSHQTCTDWHWHSGGGGGGDPIPMGTGSYWHCHAWDIYDHLHNYEAQAVSGGGGRIIGLSATTSPATSASTASGTVSHVTIDLRKATLETWEADAGFRTPQFAASDLQGKSAWRVLVRDWNPFGGTGSVLAATLVTEERSDRTRGDTDGDGLPDGDDVALGTFPVAADTDWDGLTDLFERDPQSLTLTIDGATVTRVLKTDPIIWDTDGDGLGDGEERSPGFDLAVSDPTVVDSDGDTLLDGAESLQYFSNPTLTDTDGDGLSDPDEITIWGTLPYAADSDDDGLSDYVEVTTLRSFTFSFPHIVLTQCGFNDCYAEGASRQGWFTDSGTYALPPTWQMEDVYIGTNVVDHYWAFRGSSGVRYLLSPPLALASVVTPSMRFDYSLVGAGSADVVVVTANGYEVATSLGATGGAWQAYELDLTPWQGVLEHVGFAASSSDAGFALLVDSITIRGKTDPWIADTDSDGLEDGPEVEIWLSHPLTNDTDWDGIEDRYDPRLSGDDFPPYAEEIHSIDYRTGVSFALAETSGILRWEVIIQSNVGMMYCTSPNLCGYAANFLQLEERTNNFYVLSFDLSLLPIAATDVNNVMIRAYDASGLEMEIYYDLEADASGASTEWWRELRFFVAAPATASAFGYGTATLTETATVAASSVALRAAVALGIFIFALFCCTLDQGGSPSGAQLNRVWMSSDATPLTTFPTAMGTVSLFNGFTDSAGGYQRGLGWDYIQALHPQATHQLIEDILEYGTYVTEGIWTTVSWETTVNGVETLHQLLLKDLVVISLSVAEIVIDWEGNRVVLDEERVEEHYWKRYNENPVKYPSLGEYWNDIRRNLRDPNEVWHSSTGFGDLYVRWDADRKGGFIVILNEDRTFATAGYRSAGQIIRISHTFPPGARFDVQLYPLQPRPLR